MNRSGIYDDDILEWSERQAAVVRDLARTRRDLPNEFDWEHVAEEIEDVGRSEFFAVQSFIRQILIHLIKGVFVDDKGLKLHWRKEVLVFHTDLTKRITPSMRSRCDLAELWREAVRIADADLALYKQSILPALRSECPVTLDEILDPNFDFFAGVASIQKRLDNDRSSR